MKARTSPPSPKNEPSPLCRRYPYQRRSAVFNVLTDCETYCLAFKTGAMIMLDVLKDGQMKEI